MFPIEHIKSHGAKKVRIESEATLLVLMLKTRAYDVAAKNLREAGQSDQTHFARVRRSVTNKLGFPAHVDTATVDVFAFMTTNPNELVATINHERMPMILTQEPEFQLWLNGSAREAYSLVQQYPAKKMRIVQSGSDKKDLLAA